MKNICLVIVSLLFSSLSQAGNWVQVEPFILSGAVKNFEFEHLCVQHGGFTCKDIDPYPITVYRVATVDGKQVLQQDPDAVAAHNQALADAAAIEKQKADAILLASTTMDALLTKPTLSNAETQQLVKAVATYLKNLKK